MMRKLLCLVISLTFVIFVVSEKISEESDTLAEITPRRRKHLYHALFPLVGLGGLHAISAFVAIKLKLVIVFILVVATAFFGFKFWTGGALFGCKNNGPEYHDGPIIPYDSGNIVSHSGPGISFSGGYPSGDPYSAWNPDTLSSGPPSDGDFHHDFHHSSHHDFNHDSHHDFHHDTHHDVSSDPHTDTSGPEMHSKRRVSYQGAGRQMYDKDHTFDWTSLAFAVLGVDTMVCRKRFVCEMDVQSKDNPFFGFAYNYLSRGMWTEYRNFSEVPHNLADCARMFKSCYSPADDKNKELSNQNPEEDANETTETEDNVASSTHNIESLGRQMMLRIKKKLE